mgnify:CR=1 FL=1
MAEPQSESTARDAQVEALRTLTRTLRGQILRMISKAASGHPGGSLSAVDLIATLYETRLKHDPKNAELAWQRTMAFFAAHLR